MTYTTQQQIRPKYVIQQVRAICQYKLRENLEAAETWARQDLSGVKTEIPLVKLGVLAGTMYAKKPDLKSRGLCYLFAKISKATLQKRPNPYVEELIKLVPEITKDKLRKVSKYLSRYITIRLKIEFAPPQFALQKDDAILYADKFPIHCVEEFQMQLATARSFTIYRENKRKKIEMRKIAGSNVNITFRYEIRLKW